MDVKTISEDLLSVLCGQNAKPSAPLFRSCMDDEKGNREIKVTQFSLDFIIMGGDPLTFKTGVRHNPCKGAFMVIIFKEIVILAPLRQLPDGNQRERKQKKAARLLRSALVFYLLR